MCDLTREKTFEAVRAWKREIDEWALTEAKTGVGPLPVVLIANKVRDEKKRKKCLPHLLHFNGCVNLFVVRFSID